MKNFLKAMSCGNTARRVVKALEEARVAMLPGISTEVIAISSAIQEDDQRDFAALRTSFHIFYGWPLMSRVILTTALASSATLQTRLFPRNKRKFKCPRTLWSKQNHQWQRVVKLKCLCHVKHADRYTQESH